MRPLKKFARKPISKRVVANLLTTTACGEGTIGHAGLVAAVEQAANGIVITDAIGKIEHVNPAFTAMTGYSREEAVGQHTRLLKSGRQSPALYGELWKTVSAGRVWSGELINRRRDGTFYTEEMRVTPVHGANGEITGYIAIKQDVTEQRGGHGGAGVPRRGC